MPLIKTVCLASGSKGNSTYIEAGDVRVLVDAGLSARQIKLRLEEIGVEVESIMGVFVTHEHVDHVGAIPVLTRRFNTPIYMSRLAADSPIGIGPFAGKIAGIRQIEAGSEVTLGDLKIQPFSVSHDAADPLGFRFEIGGAAIAVASDLGCITRLVCDRFAGCQAIVCESNHDTQMLRDGSYPMRLKRRISGKFGHLSNSDCRQLLENVYHEDLQAVVLAHLSEENNTPQLAYEENQAFLDSVGSKAQLYVARQDRVGTVVEIG
jgi:phosphoribosyl 1,2-cyclic phosphodiesterase